MTYVTKHTERHGASTHATRGLDFLEAVAPRLGEMAERYALEGMSERDRRLLEMCARAIPSYVDELSDRYGKMVAARSALASIVERRGGGCEHYTTGPQSCYHAGRTDDAPFLDEQTCDACLSHRTLNGPLEEKL